MHYEGKWVTEGSGAKKIAYVTPSSSAFGTGRVYGSLISSTGLNFPRVHRY